MPNQMTGPSPKRTYLLYEFRNVAYSLSANLLPQESQQGEQLWRVSHRGWRAANERSLHHLDLRLASHF